MLNSTAIDYNYVNLTIMMERSAKLSSTFFDFGMFKVGHRCKRANLLHVFHVFRQHFARNSDSSDKFFQVRAFNKLKLKISQILEYIQPIQTKNSKSQGKKSFHCLNPVIMHHRIAADKHQQRRRRRTIEQEIK